MQLQPIKYFLLLLSCSLLAQTGNAQILAERKIIIENNKFYFFTVDAETQLATLHTGNKNQNLHEGSEYKLPLGRSSDAPIVPLCFDISKGKLTYINWILNTSFSRMEGIKRIDLDEAANYTKRTDAELLQQSIDIPALTSFRPWQYTLQQNNVVDQNFFDMALNENGNIEVWISNGSSLSVWEYDGKDWQRSEPFTQPFDKYFTLVTIGKKLLFVNHNMDQVIEYKTDKDDKKMFLGQYDMSAAADQLRNLDQQVLVVDKDSRKSWYFPAKLLEDKRISLDKLIKTRGTAFSLVKAVEEK
jgi:hypothetical protein